MHQASGPGRARRDAAARAMQGWHSQRLLGNGEVGDPLIKVCEGKEIYSLVTSSLWLVPSRLTKNICTYDFCFLHSMTSDFTFG